MYVIRFAVDPLFPPPTNGFSSSKYNTNDILPELKFELIFDAAAESNEFGNNSSSMAEEEK